MSFCCARCWCWRRASSWVCEVGFGQFTLRAFGLEKTCAELASRRSHSAIKNTHPQSLVQSVLVKSSSALSSQPSGIDHFYQQRARAVFGIAQTVVQHPHNVEANVEANKIGQRERAHGMRHAQLEHFIDCLRRGHTFHYREHGLVQQGHEHTVRHEAGRVIDFDRRLLQFERKVAYGCERFLSGGQAADYFHQLHNRHRVEKMHSDDLLRPLCQGAKLCNGDRRCIRSQDNFGPYYAVEVAKNFCLDFEFLGRGLDDEVAVRQPVAIDNGIDPLQCGRPVVHRNLVFRYLAFKVFCDGIERVSEETLLHVAQHDGVAATGKHLSDPVPHGARAHYPDTLDFHSRSPLFAGGPCWELCPLPKRLSLTPRQHAWNQDATTHSELDMKHAIQKKVAVTACSS